MPQALEHPVRTNQIPRQIPEQNFYTQPVPGVIMGGVLPFGCIFIQLFFILNSLWQVHFYTQIYIYISLLINILSYKIFFIGQVKYIICSDFSFWFSLYSLSHVPRRRFYSVISIFARR